MYQLQIQAASLKEFQQKVIELAAKFGMEEHLPTQIPLTPIKEQVVEVKEVPAAKRGPKAKTKPTPQLTVKLDVNTPEQIMNGEETAVEETAEIPTPAATVETSAATITQEMVSEALRGVNKRKGFDALRPLLGKFEAANGKKCQRLSEVQEKDYAKFINVCEQTV